MSLSTLQHEFPAWHLLNAFDVFHLGPKGPEENRKDGCNSALTQLAKTFGVDESQLKSQYTSVLPTALALQRTSGLDNRTCWKETVLRLQGRSEMRGKYPLDALHKAWVG